MTEKVDELLDRVATEVDRGGSAAEIVEQTTLQTAAGRQKGYDRDGVDIFLSQFLTPQSELMSSSQMGSQSSGSALGPIGQGDPSGN